MPPPALPDFHCSIKLSTSRAVAAVFLAAFGAGTAIAQNSSVEEKRFEEEIKAVDAASRGKWVELESGRYAVRSYAAVLGRNDITSRMLVHIRSDHASVADSDVSTTVETVLLDCGKGERQLLAARGYDRSGALVFENMQPRDQIERIQSFFAGREQQLCSRLYLLRLVPNGYARFSQALADRMNERATRTADRPVPVPTAPPHANELLKPEP
jgi:hypothetical protein